ncbi:MAG: glycosyltransferase family 39 protein [Candidatus Omnitrophica bacterium]|nr:glycosyltransferase family 39 protein [Candidatus Omnitrophota bacterium]
MVNIDIKKWLKANTVKLVLSAVILFYIVNNYLWLNRSFLLDFFEIYGCYFGDTWEFYNNLINFNISGIMNIFHNSTSSFYSLTAALIAIISGKSFIAVNLFNNLFYFIIATISIFLIGSKLADKNTGLLTTVIFSLYPAIFRISRYFILEFGLIGLVTFSVWCLLKTEGFYNRRYSLLFGLSAGMGMIIKYSFAVFILGPLVYIIITNLFSLSRTRKIRSEKYPFRLFNIAFASLLCLTIMSVRYNFSYIRDILMRGSYYATPWYDFKNIRVCTSGLIEHQLSLLFFVLLILAVFSFFSKTENKVKIILFSWIFIPWLTFTLTPHPNSVKYVSPCLPAIALLSAIGFMHLFRQKSKIKYYLISLIIIIGVIQYYGASFGSGLNLHKYTLSINNREIHLFFTDDEFGEMWNRPRDISGFGKIVSSIKNNCDLNRRNLVYVFTYPNSGFGTRYSAWYALIWFKDFPCEVKPFMDDAYGGLFEDNRLRAFTVLQDVQKADFILYYGPSAVDIKMPYYIDQLLIKRVRSDLQAHSKKEKILTLNQFLNSEDLEKFKKQFRGIIDNFILIEEIAEIGKGNKYKAFLYKRS